MSGKNKEKLAEIINALSTFGEGFIDENTEEPIMKTEDIAKMIDEAIKKAATTQSNPAPNPENTSEINEESVQKMIDTAIAKAVGNDDSTNSAPDALSEDSIEKMIACAVEKAMSPILKHRGLANNLNDETDPVEKSDQHYLAGVI